MPFSGPRCVSRALKKAFFFLKISAGPPLADRSRRRPRLRAWRSLAIRLTVYVPCHAPARSVRSPLTIPCSRPLSCPSRRPRPSTRRATTCSSLNPLRRTRPSRSGVCVRCVRDRELTLARLANISTTARRARWAAVCARRRPPARPTRIPRRSCRPQATTATTASSPRAARPRPRPFTTRLSATRSRPSTPRPRSTRRPTRPRCAAS